MFSSLFWGMFLGGLEFSSRFYVNLLLHPRWWLLNSEQTPSNSIHWGASEPLCPIYRWSIYPFRFDCRRWCGKKQKNSRWNGVHMWKWTWFTWKWTPGRGDSFWKPSLSGSTLVFGGLAYFSSTPLKLNIFALNNDAWKRILSFLGMVHFKEAMLNFKGLCFEMLMLDNFCSCPGD